MRCAHPVAAEHAAPAITPHGLADRVTEAIRVQDIRCREERQDEELLDLRRARNALLDVLARAMTVASDVLAREEYDRPSIESAGVAWTAARHEGEGYETTVLAKRVTTATIRLAVVVTLTMAPRHPPPIRGCHGVIAETTRPRAESSEAWNGARESAVSRVWRAAVWDGETSTPGTGRDRPSPRASRASRDLSPGARAQTPRRAP